MAWIAFGMAWGYKYSKQGNANKLLGKNETSRPKIYIAKSQNKIIINCNAK